MVESMGQCAGSFTAKWGCEHVPHHNFDIHSRDKNQIMSFPIEKSSKKLSHCFQDRV